MLGYLHGELFQSRDYLPATMSRHIETLKRYYAWLYRKGYLDTLPDFDWNYKHLFTSEPSNNTAYESTQHTLNSLYVDRETFQKLMAGISSNNAFIIARDELALRLGYDCGTRAHEVLNLDVKIVRQAISKAKDENNGIYASVDVKLTGKGNVNRLLLLIPDICEIIDIYLKRFRMKMNNGNGPLLCTIYGTPIKSMKHASTVFRNACKTAGIQRHHHQGYHRLRKTFGTNLVDECYKAGTDPWVEVPRRMGHRDVETTKLYIQFDALRNHRSSVLSSLSMEAMKWNAIHS